MRAYRPHLHRVTTQIDSFEGKRRAFLDDRYGIAHILLPVLQEDPAAFFTNGDDEDLQEAWARQQGMRAGTSRDDILLAQIEHHRTEVFYNLHPMMFGDAFLARLPGSVRKTVAWRAAPSQGGQFLKHDLIVNNFPSLLDGFRRDGAVTALFSPAHDPIMDEYAARQDRPTDVLFVGTYSQYHKRRAEVLHTLAGLGDAKVVLHLDRSRLNRLAETPAGLFGPLRKHRRPAEIRKVARGPVFGRKLLDALSKAKIVVNGAIDMAGHERGNMRIWEALGCGCAMLTDQGQYPTPMSPGIDFAIFGGTADLKEKALNLLHDDGERRRFAADGHKMIRTAYRKEQQWSDFVNLV